MASLMPQGWQRYTDNNGNNLAGGKLWTYEAGGSTPLATYSDQAGATPNTNPIVLNARGEATIFWGSAPYKVKLTDASDVEIRTQDNLHASADLADLVSTANGKGSALVGYSTGVKTVAAALDERLPEIGTYALLQAYSGSYTSYYVRGVTNILDCGAGVFRVDSADTTSADNGGTILVDADGRRWKREFIGTINTRWFGAVWDGVTNDGPALAACIACALAGNREIELEAGTALIDGYEFVLTAPVVICGKGRLSTKLLFNGSPAKTVRTYATWRTEYDSANYAASSDAAISCGFVVTSQNVFLRDFNLQVYWDATTNHPLPFDSATDYPTSGYDVGVLVQVSDVSMERLLINGPWGSTTNVNTGGIKLDVTQPGGAVEHVKIIDCDVHGRWGLVVEGPHGSGAAPNYADMNALDTRGVGGVSDLLCIGSNFHDTSANEGVRLTIDGVAGKRVRRFTANSGALFIDGQALNSAKRQQQMTFLRCRFASVDPYAYYLNFCNRVDFISCHSEYRVGFLMTDGVTVVAAADVSITTTVNARGISYIGGEKSGETDSRTFKDATNNLNLVSEFGLDEPVSGSYTRTGRIFGGIELRDRGLWTPGLLGSSANGSPTYTTQTGTYCKIGNLVFITGRITLSAKDAISGNITIGGLPYTASSIFGGGGDSSVAFGIVSNVTSLDGLGGVINDNSKIISLTRFTSAGAVGNITNTHLTDTSRMDFSGCYMTEDA